MGQHRGAVRASPRQRETCVQLKKKKTKAKNKIILFLCFMSFLSHFPEKEGLLQARTASRTPVPGAAAGSPRRAGRRPCPLQPALPSTFAKHDVRVRRRLCFPLGQFLHLQSSCSVRDLFYGKLSNFY